MWIIKVYPRNWCEKPTNFPNCFIKPHTDLKSVDMRNILHISQSTIRKLDWMNMNRDVKFWGQITSKQIVCFRNIQAVPKTAPRNWNLSLSFDFQRLWFYFPIFKRIHTTNENNQYFISFYYPILLYTSYLIAVCATINFYQNQWCNFPWVLPYFTSSVRMQNCAFVSFQGRARNVITAVWTWNILSERKKMGENMCTWNTLKVITFFVWRFTIFPEQIRMYELFVEYCFFHYILFFSLVWQFCFMVHLTRNFVIEFTLVCWIFLWIKRDMFVFCILLLVCVSQWIRAMHFIRICEVNTLFSFMLYLYVQIFHLHKYRLKTF